MALSSCHAVEQLSVPVQSLGLFLAVGCHLALSPSSTLAYVVGFITAFLAGGYNPHLGLLWSAVRMAPHPPPLALHCRQHLRTSMSPLARPRRQTLGAALRGAFKLQPRRGKSV